jgi:FkbM family methyltransferase
MHIADSRPTAGNTSNTHNADQRCGLVVDVGANLGTLSLLALSKKCTVRAYEFQQSVASVLRLSFNINFPEHQWSISTNPVFDEAGKYVGYAFDGATFDEKDLSASARRNPGGVGISIVEEKEKKDELSPKKTVRLDDEFPAPRRIAFLKIDVEGYEINVLRGSTRLLKDGRIDSLCAELRPGQSGDFVKLLYPNGYKCYLSTIYRNRKKSLFVKERSIPTFLQAFHTMTPETSATFNQHMEQLQAQSKGTPMTNACCMLDVGNVSY